MPRFPFRPGTTYVVLVAPELVASGESGRVDPDGFVEMAIDRPARAGGDPARVVAVQPTAHDLAPQPSAVLRLVLRFDERG